MAEIKKTINDEISYFSKRNLASISGYKECLEKFYANFKNEISLETETSIFLDASILLRYYSISFNAREKLFQFIEKNKGRIVLTSQIQYEFLKNREDLIQRFFEQVIPKISKDFNSEIVNKMKHFVDVHKVVLKDYPFVEKGMQQYQIELNGLHDKLIADVEVKEKEYHDLVFKDKLVDLLCTCRQTDSLSIEEISTLKKHFELLSRNVKSETVDSVLNRANGAFPGLGDIKLKPDNPYGDFLIFHEIMKFMLNEKKDAIFLTFDNSKGDWMNKNGSPHLHYVQNMYANTENLLYIVDADRTLGELLDVNIESLLATDAKGTIPKSGLIKFVDFVSIPWALNHWGGKVAFREGRNILFKGDKVKDLSKTEGCHCNLPGILELNRLYKVECKAFARGNNPTGKLSLWCHDSIGEPNVPTGISDETGYIPISPEGTTLTLYFIPRNNANMRIHIQYMPGENETGEILVEDGVSIYLGD